VSYISNCVAPEGEGRFGVLWGMISKIDFFDASCVDPQDSFGVKDLTS
jgi:hypothetical protein